MISIILPYWDRQEAANKAFELFEKHYSNADIEIVVVDDGNKIPFKVPSKNLNVKVIRLPEKNEPKSPVTCWNAGVKEASGEVIVLSCIEILHPSPVLEKMEAAVLDGGDNAYVLAAAWCPEEGAWHCHSSVRVPRNPEGTGIAFCGAMRKALFEKAGGFDEDYRDGAGYEDNDFINRMLAAGANFIIRDDLTVVHPKSGATIQWGAEKFERNFSLYKEKWPNSPGIKMINFVCLNAQNYLGMGTEYVNVLFDMVRRNMKNTTPFRFFCLTDNPDGLHSNISVVSLPDDIKGWYGKLYMFKKGVFNVSDGERMVFLDLDTLIISSLRWLDDYGGDMAILRDFYHHERGAPGIVFWKNGFGAHIWDEWEEQGRPFRPMGDLDWINELDGGEFVKKIDRIQDIFPSKVVSYKAHCRPFPPNGASIVCFHGEPRPHNCHSEWVSMIWRIGGGMTPEFSHEINTREDKLWENVEKTNRRNLPKLKLGTALNGEILLVAGGPSLKRSIDDIKRRRNNGAIVAAMNGSADYLYEHGVTADWHIVLDSRPSNARFVKSGVALRYFVSATCDDAVFDAINGRNITVFHPHLEGIESHVLGRTHLITGGTTVGLLAMSIAFTQGFRIMHLYGYDSSYGESHHAYVQAENDDDIPLDVVAGGLSFKAAGWMVTQVQEFQQLAISLAEDGCEIHTHGSGLLQHVAWMLMNQEGQNSSTKETVQ